MHPFITNNTRSISMNVMIRTWAPLLTLKAFVRQHKMRSLKQSYFGKTRRVCRHQVRVRIRVSVSSTWKLLSSSTKIKRLPRISLSSHQGLDSLVALRLRCTRGRKTRIRNPDNITGQKSSKWSSQQRPKILSCRLLLKRKWQTTKTKLKVEKQFQTISP